MAENAFLDAKVIKDKLIEKGVLREAPGLADENVPLNLADISGFPESFHLVLDFIINLDDPGFDARKCKMPNPLAKAVIKMRTKEMMSKRISFASLFQGLSSQLDMTSKEIYDLMGMDAEDAAKLQELLVINATEENIDKSLVPLKKVAQALNLDKLKMERMIFTSFDCLFPRPISLEVCYDPDDPSAPALAAQNAREAESCINTDAIEITERIIAKLFP